MSLLRLAVKNQRWDLAAHTIVLATVRALNKGELDAGNNRKKKILKAKPER